MFKIFSIACILFTYCIAKEDRVEDKEKRVELRGGTLVILDSSCNAKKDTPLKERVSKISSNTHEECEEYSKNKEQ